jgi:hypothetical protein
MRPASCRQPTALLAALALVASGTLLRTAAAARASPSAAPAGVGGAGVEWTKPWYCHDLDCPRFKIVKNLTDLGLELRHYEAG